MLQAAKSQSPPEVAEANRKQAADDKARRKAIVSSRRQAEEDAERANRGKMLPTPQRKQHGSIIETTVVGTDTESAKAGARVRRTQSPIERYSKRGLISERQAMAADDLRADWEFGLVGIKGGDRLAVGGGIIHVSDAQLDAATAYRQAVQAIGQRVAAIVLPIVIGDAAGGEINALMLARRDGAHIGAEVTAGELAARSKQNEKRIMGVLVVGLDMLADHYERGDNRQRAARYG